MVVSAGDNNSVWVKGYMGSVGYRYLYVLREMVRYLRVSSPLVISFGWAVRLLGTVAADLQVRARLTPGACCWQYVRNSVVLCGGRYFLWAILWRVKLCVRCLRTLLHLITPSYLSLAWNVHCLPLVCVVCGFIRCGCLTVYCCVSVRSPRWGWARPSVGKWVRRDRY